VFVRHKQKLTVVGTWLLIRLRCCCSCIDCW